MASFQAGKISVIDISHGNALGTPFFVFDLLPEDESLPTAIAVNRRGKVYVTNFGSDTVIGMTRSTIAAAQGGAAAAEPPDVVRGAGTFPSSLAITPDDTALFVGSFDPGGRLGSSIPATNGKLAVVDAARNQVATSIGVDRFPVGVALLPRTSTLLGSPETLPVGVAPTPTPTLNCYMLDCINPADCIVPLGRHQAKLGGLRSGQGEHRCGGAGPRPTPTPTR